MDSDLHQRRHTRQVSTDDTTRPTAHSQPLIFSAGQIESIVRQSQYRWIAAKER